MIEPKYVSLATIQANRNRRALSGVWLLIGIVVMLAAIAALQPLR